MSAYPSNSDSVALPSNLMSHRRPPHARIAASKHAGKVSLSLRGASALSGNNWAELLYLRPLFIRMRRSSSPALRVVTLLPATRTYSQRGWGCSPARLAEFRARLAAGLRQEQVDALLSDPVDHLPCRDTDLPERHMPKPFKNSRLERHHHSRTRVANAQFPVGETRHV